MARSKAYLFRGVEIRWTLRAGAHLATPRRPRRCFHFPNGLADFLAETRRGRSRRSRPSRSPAASSARARPARWSGRSPGRRTASARPTASCAPTATPCRRPEGGTHEAGLRAVLTRGLKAYAELTGEKRGALITADDVMAEAGALISVFVRNPEFQGQTKERLSSIDAQRLVEARAARPVRPLADRPAQGRRRPARLRRRPRRGAAEAAQGQGGRPRLGHPQAAPARQAGRLLRQRGRRHRDLHRRGRLAPAARPSRPATAAPRRSCRCAARSSTSPPPASTSCAPTRSSPT